MNKKEAMQDVLRSFFNEDCVKDNIKRYLDCLQEDFQRVITDLSRFIERRYDLLRMSPEFKFMEILPPFLDAYYTTKEGYLKQHYEMLSKVSTLNLSKEDK